MPIMLPRTEKNVISLAGGLDLVTTPIQVKPGKVISSDNFEPDINGGYKRMAGIERFDGRPRPSDADYHMVEGVITGSILVGDTITGVTSGATAKVIVVVSSTSWVVTRLTGTFVAETVNVSGSPEATVSDVTQDGAATGALHATYNNLAADDYRADITTVPGSGPVRGVRYYNGVLYAFRDNAGATACVMHKETASGWTAITFGQELQFDNAVGEISEGDSVTGLSSGANGVVKRALLRTGTWTSAGVGTLVFDSVTGGPFTDGEALQVSAATKADADGVESSITLLPGGRFDFDNVNFFGTSATLRMYCADGVNELGEFDGTRWVPIRTGITGAKPKFVAGHRNHLFTAVDSSIQHSGVGSPYSWTALTGASELALGEECTGMLPQTGDASSGALVASTNNKIFILYGTSSADWNLVTHSPDSGGRAYTGQNIGFAHFLDTKGVTQLIASQAFGGFQLSVLTQAIQPIIDAKRGLETASGIVRKTNQYRLFFSDGTGLIMQVVPNSSSYSVKFGAIMPFDYGARVMNAIDSTIDSSGIERIFGACTDGYVYELDRGTSFDGDAIAAHFLMAFNHSKSFRTKKRYRRTVLQFRAENTVDISVGYDLAYGNLDTSYGDSVSAGSVIAKTGQAVGGYWDSFNWDSFTWDASYAQELNVDTPGSGDSIAILVSGETDENEPYTIHTCTTYFLPGRELR